MYLRRCYPHRSLAFDSVSRSGCAVAGITKEVDSRREAVRQHIVRHMALLPTLLMAMIDCVGGTPFQRVNSRTVEGARRVEEHKKPFRQCWGSLVKWMPSVVANKTAIIIEWPAWCEYWREPVVANLLPKYGFESRFGDGCALGLRSHVREGDAQEAAPVLS